MIELPSLQQIVDVMRTYYNQYGYGFVLVGAFLENILLVSFVWPGGVIVLLGAIYSRAGDLALPIVVVLAWIGALLGTIGNYAIGRFARPLTRRLGRFGYRQLVAHDRSIGRAIGWIWPAAVADGGLTAVRNRFDRAIATITDRIQQNGASILLASQVIGHARNATAFAAGLSRYPFGRFLMIEAAGTLLTSLLTGCVGYLIGENLDLIGQILGRVNVGLVLILIAVWLARNHLLEWAGRLTGRSRPSEG